MTTDTAPVSILLARLAGEQVGFDATAIREILRSVAMAPLPGAPEIIEGVVNFRGRIVPVVNLRARLSLEPADNSPEQFLVLLEAHDRLVAVRVDDVDDVMDIARADLEAPREVSPTLQRIAGIAATASGALVIFDTEAFLTGAERDALDALDALDPPNAARAVAG